MKCIEQACSSACPQTGSLSSAPIISLDSGKSCQCTVERCLKAKEALQSTPSNLLCNYFLTPHLLANSPQTMPVAELSFRRPFLLRDSSAESCPVGVTSANKFDGNQSKLARNDCFHFCVLDMGQQESCKSYMNYNNN